MNQNPHWKQLIWNWASIIFGNALYSLAVALFLEPAGLFTGGAGRMALGDAEADVRAGDCVVIPPGTPHHLVNTGGEPLVLLCCCAPPYSHEDTVLVDA